MSSEESYLPDFFTPERLEWYRKLSERFPLWCGIWPEKEINLPEAWMWSPDRPIWTELDESEDQFLGFWFTPTPTPKLMPRPVLVWSEPNPLGGTEPDEPPFIEHHVSVTEPLAYAAWFAALNYISHDWSKDPPKPRRRRRVTNDSDHLLEPLKEVLTRHPIEEPNQHWLNVRIREGRKWPPGSVKREKAIDDLEQYWIGVGRAAGIIPPLQGGRKVHLSSAFLAQLLDEADEFAREIKDWDADEDVRAVAPLLDDESDVDMAAAMSHRERVRRGFAAPRALKDAPRYITWCQLLRYPFLSHGDVQSVLDSPRGRKSAATALMLNRLPIARTTLRKKLSLA